MNRILAAHRRTGNPQFSPSQSPLSNEILDTAAQLEADHAYKAREYAELARFHAQLARFHAQQARAARAIRKQAERLLWNEAAEVAS